MVGWYPIFFAVPMLVVSPRALVSSAESASATPVLPKIACLAHSPAQVRGPCWYARVLPRRDGIGPTKKRAQYARIFHRVSFAWYHCHDGGAVAREELCAWSVCRNLCGWLGSSMYQTMSWLIFVDVGCVPDFATGPQSPVGAAVFAPYPAQV
jgi:hypothetical protein